MLKMSSNDPSTPASYLAFLEKLKKIKDKKQEELNVLLERSNPLISSSMLEDLPRNDVSSDDTIVSNSAIIKSYSGDKDSDALECIHKEPITGKELLSPIFDSPFLKKVTVKLPGPCDKPKFPFLKKGQGTAKYGNRKLKRFVKRNDVSKNTIKSSADVNYASSKLKKGVVKPQNMKDIPDKLLDNKSTNFGLPKTAKDSERLQAFETLEELAGHDSFQSTASHVMGLLDMDQTITSTPMRETQRIKKIKLVDRYDSNDQEEILKPPEKDTEKNCDNVQTNFAKVKFQPGLEILEYDHNIPFPYAESPSVNDSNVYSLSDLEEIGNINLNEKLERANKYFNAPENIEDGIESLNTDNQKCTSEKIDTEPEKILLLSKIESLDKSIKIFHRKNKELDKERDLLKTKLTDLENEKYEFEIEKLEFAEAKKKFLQYAMEKQETLERNKINASSENIESLNCVISQQLDELNKKVEQIQSENREMKHMIAHYQKLQSDSLDKVGRCKAKPTHPPQDKNPKILKAKSNTELKSSKPAVKKLRSKVSQSSQFNENQNGTDVDNIPVKLTDQEDSSTCKSLIQPQLIPDKEASSSSTSGTTKHILPDRTELVYINGDRCTIYQDRAVYYFSEQNIKQTTYNLGKKEVEFPNGQKEIYFPDGSYQVLFPNNASVSVYSDGSEKKVAADGTVTHTKKDGSKAVYYPNGQKEISDDGNLYRLWPDGTVKILHKDGTQETKYPNGKIRIKDQDGNVKIIKDISK